MSIPRWFRQSGHSYRVGPLVSNHLDIWISIGLCDLRKLLLSKPFTSNSISVKISFGRHNFWGFRIRICLIQMNKAMVGWTKGGITTVQIWLHQKLTFKVKIHNESPKNSFEIDLITSNSHIFILKTFKFGLNWPFLTRETVRNPWKVKQKVRKNHRYI